MGISNKIIFPFVIKCCQGENTLNLILNKLNKNSTTASIGDQSINTSPLIKEIYKKEATMHFYDILCKDRNIDNKHKTFYFDINEDWNKIKDYDLVTFMRVTMYVNDKEIFFRNFKNCIKNNKHIIIDFNLQMRDKIQYYNFDLRNMISKKELDEIHPKLFKYKNIHNTIFLEDFEKHGIKLELIDKMFNYIKNDFIFMIYIKGDN